MKTAPTTYPVHELIRNRWSPRAFTPQPVVPDSRNRGQRTYCQVNPLHDQLRVQLAQEAVELKNAELDLEQLDRRASMVAVPREWRRGW